MISLEEEAFRPKSNEETLQQNDKKEDSIILDSIKSISINETVETTESSDIIKENHKLVDYERPESKSRASDSDNDTHKTKKYSSLSSLSSTYDSIKSRSRSPRRSHYNKSASFSSRSSSIDSYKKSPSSNSRRPHNHYHHRHHYHNHSHNHYSRHHHNRRRKRSRSRTTSYRHHHNNSHSNYKKQAHYSNYNSSSVTNANQYEYNNRSRSHSLANAIIPKSPSTSPPPLTKKRVLDGENHSIVDDELKRVKCDSTTSEIILNQINEITSSSVSVKEKAQKLDEESSTTIKSKKKSKKKNEVRRSVRIKHIETKKIHDKETELAEKLKQLNENESFSRSPPQSPSSSSSNQQFSSTMDETNSIQKQQSSSPKGFKKMLLSKAFNEIAARSEYNNEINKLVTENWPKFSYLDENVYLFKYKKSKSNKQAKRMTCDCSTSEQERNLGLVPCGEDCLNRMLMIECGSRCACDSYCTNKRFQRHQYSFIIPFQTSFKGWGLKALDEIKNGTFIIEYIGEVVDVKEFKKRCEKYSKHKNEHFYFMSLRNDQFIDATKKGNIARFFNHSCDPNCETQKWTVNGELRIGFFARKNIVKDEELTFDYQFQTFGEKQQKCYCGSDKCRGTLGTSNSSSSANNLDHIWDESDSDEDDEEEDEEEDDEEDTTSENESVNSLKKQKKKKKYNRDSDDLDLQDQIDCIKKLTNKDNVVKLCRIMIRAESLKNRDSILDILLNTNQDACLKLFIDYHGLKLLWSWMVDIDRFNEVSYNNLKLKLINVLHKIPIKNRTIVEECKLLSIVQRWSDTDSSFHNKLNNSNLFSTPSTEDKVLSTNAWINSIVNKLADCAVDRSNSSLIVEEVRLKAKCLYETWNELQQAFKIPKKQQNEERKEHEREVTVSIDKNENKYKDKGFKASDRKSSYINEDGFSSNHSFSKNYHSRRHFKYFQNNNNRFDQPRISKEERRLLFEQKHRDSVTNLNSNPTPPMQTPPSSTSDVQQPVVTFPALQTQNTTSMSLKWLFDTQLNQWVQVYCPAPTEYASYPLNSCYHEFPTESQLDLYHQLAVAPPPPPPLNVEPTAPMNSIQLSEEHFKDLKNAVEQFLPASAETTVTREKLDIPLPPPKNIKEKRKLPPNWKHSRNSEGRIYYYNKLTKKSQWHFPCAEDQKEDLKQSITSPPCVPQLEPSTTSADMESSTTTTIVGKKLRESLREQLSKLVIKLLQPYMKDDCKFGHVTNNDDFKHLARKFTHSILEKELGRMTAAESEEVELTKRVKIKAHEYINKYMFKFKGDYTRKTDIDDNV